MFLANNHPEKDLAVIQNAMRNIEKIAPKRVVLISTIAVYDHPYRVDEDADIDETKLSAYGKNRRLLEKFVQQTYADHLIVRLPALFGSGLKKNFIYDLIHIIPAMLTDEKYAELISRDDLLSDYYTELDNGFWKCRPIDRHEQAILKDYFKRAGFSALNFTDSRSVYQYYNLAYLWEHIEKALTLGIKLFNTATEPIATAELYEAIYGQSFANCIRDVPFMYDYRTKHADAFGGHKDYLFDRKQVLADIKTFINLEVSKWL